MIIDANVFKGYYEVSMGNPHNLCGCPEKLFSNYNNLNPIYYDDGNKIESEWRNAVDHEWFDPWLASQLLAGTITYITPEIDVSLETKLRNKGFPNGSDKVYVRVGVALTKIIQNNCIFYTEDLDFFDPTHKKSGSKTRLKLLMSSSGTICKILKKNNIIVSSVPV